MLAIITAIYKRHDLTRVVLFYYKSLNLPIRLIAVGSEGEKSKQIALDAGWEYIEAPNYPVSNKFNIAMQAAKGCDGVIVIGSDDLISKDRLEEYLKLPKDVNFIIQPDTLHFFDTYTQRLYHYTASTKFGAGRYLSKKILNKCNWKAWPNGLNSGMDNGMLEKLKVNVHAYQMKGIMVDVKHTENITPKYITFACTEVNSDIMAKKKLPVKELKELQPKSVESVHIDMNKDHEIISLGTFKDMPKDERYVVSADLAKVLLMKGAAKLA